MQLHNNRSIASFSGNPFQSMSHFRSAHNGNSWRKSTHYKYLVLFRLLGFPRGLVSRRRFSSGVRNRPIFNNSFYRLVFDHEVCLRYIAYAHVCYGLSAFCCSAVHSRNFRLFCVRNLHFLLASGPSLLFGPSFIQSRSHYGDL